MAEIDARAIEAALDRVCDAAIYRDTAGAVYRPGADTELAEARAAVRALLAAQPPTGSLDRWNEAIEVVRRHRRHIQASPGVGAECQTYGIAVCDDIEADISEKRRASARSRLRFACVIPVLPNKEHPPMNDWQLIRTAPLDGTLIAVCRYVPYVHWRYAFARWEKHIGSVSGWRKRWHDGDTTFGGESSWLDFDPTHWLPLPVQTRAMQEAVHERQGVPRKQGAE
jgi:hypothetical protein